MRKYAFMQYIFIENCDYAWEFNNTIILLNTIMMYLDVLSTHKCSYSYQYFKFLLLAFLFLISHDLFCIFSELELVDIFFLCLYIVYLKINVPCNLKAWTILFNPHSILLQFKNLQYLHVFLSITVLFGALIHNILI